MNPFIKKLHHIAGQPERHIVGLMSGTSLDGLDVALCRISGNGATTAVQLVRFDTVPYDDPLKTEIRQVFARETIDFQQLVILNETIGTRHGQWVADCLRRWQVDPAQVDLVASHGQTVFHSPRSQHGLAGPNATLQIGDGDHVSAACGIITLSDFRQKHIAHGGEGAPLAVYGDYLIFSQLGENRLLLNLGGIANFTWLPANGSALAVFTTDTGPGNTLLDACTRHYFGQPYDENGALAAQGQINTALLTELKASAFFDAPFPKTTGPEVFNLGYLAAAQTRSQTTTLDPQSLLATLARFSAETIAEAIGRVLPNEPVRVLLSGGGAHNPTLTKHLRQLLPQCTFGLTDDLGISGDAKEAVLFAVLANEAIAAPAPSDFGSRFGIPTVTMGKISFPA